MASDIDALIEEAQPYVDLYDRLAPAMKGTTTVIVRAEVIARLLRIARAAKRMSRARRRAEDWLVRYAGEETFSPEAAADEAGEVIRSLLAATPPVPAALPDEVREAADEVRAFFSVTKEPYTDFGRAVLRLLDTIAPRRGGA